VAGRLLKPNHFPVDIDEWSVLVEAEKLGCLGRFAQQFRYAVNPATYPRERNEIQLILSTTVHSRKKLACTAKRV
jgi:hypothetical protein